MPQYLCRRPEGVRGGCILAQDHQGACEMIGGPNPSSENPRYSKMRQPDTNGMYMIACDEGWRSSIVATGMYEWAADWLLGVLGRRPYAPEQRS